MLWHGSTHDNSLIHCFYYNEKRGLPMSPRRTHARKQTNRSIPITPVISFYIRLMIKGSVDFFLGVAACYIASRIPDAHIRLPPNVLAEAICYEQVCPSVFRVIVIYFPAVLTAAASLSFPILFLYVLGVRRYDFFPYSRIWNFIFCASYGAVFYQMLDRLYSNGSEYGGVWAVMAAALPIICFFGSFAFELQSLLQSNRIAARGLPIPCIRGNGAIRYAFYEQPTAKGLKQDIRRYTNAARRYIVQSFVTNLFLFYSILMLQYFTA